MHPLQEVANCMLVVEATAHVKDFGLCIKLGFSVTSHVQLNY